VYDGKGMFKMTIKKYWKTIIVLIVVFSLASCERDDTIVDTTKPTFVNVSDLTIEFGSTFDELSGVEAMDNIDGSLTRAIVVDGTVNPFEAGEYTITYTVVDNAGNEATAIRVITVLEEVTYTVTLYNEDEVIEVFEEIAIETVLDLPVLEENGSIFVGFEDLDELYYGKYVVTKDIDLFAVFEIATEVFEVFEIPDSEPKTGRIDGYSGRATTLVIPQMIDGKIIDSIGRYAFEESSLLEVVLPMDSIVGFQAFLNSTELKKVSFYGEYLLPKRDGLSGPDYDEIITNNSSQCVIVEGSIESGRWVFEEGCPITEVLEYSEIVMNGMSFYTYYVLLDKNLAEFTTMNTFLSSSFEGATALETVMLKESDALIYIDAFLGCSSLTTIIVPEGNQHFSVIDNVLYNEDQTNLVYYPRGLQASSYTIPDSVENIMVTAFYENETIERIVIPEHFEGEFGLQGLSALTEIIVDEDNQSYYTVDGILFSEGVLVKYPAAKTGDSYTLPEGITLIAPAAFSDNKYLETIDFGNQLEHVGTSAFTLSEKLEVLDFPASVISLGYGLIVDSSIHTVLVNRSFVVDGSITMQGGSFTKRNMDALTIFLPDDSIDIYGEDVMWRAYSEHLKPLSEYPQT